MAKDTMDEAHYWSAHHKEKKMYGILENIKEELENNKTEAGNQLKLGKFVKL
jgi:ERCC4-related helicase